MATAWILSLSEASSGYRTWKLDLLGGFLDGGGQLGGTATSVGEVGRHGGTGAVFRSDLVDGGDVFVVVAGEHIDRDDRRAAVDLHVLELLAQVVATLVDLVGIGLEQILGERLAGDDLVVAGVSLEAPHGRDEHGSIGGEARVAALDVEEALGAHVGTEARLGEEEVAGVDADAVGHDRAVAGGDVAERAGVHEGRGVLQRLHEVGLDGLTQDDGHRPGGADLLGGDGIAGLGVAQHDAAHAGSEVVQVGGESQGGHDLGGCGDVEAGLAGNAVELAAEADGDVAKGTVVDVDDAAPGDVVNVEASLVAVVEVRADHGRAEVVRSSDGVHVAGEVEVEQLHRDHLAVAAAGGAALDAEGGAHRGLADGDGGGRPDVLERLTETDGGGGLAFTKRGGGDGGDNDVFRLRAIGHLLDGVERDLCGARAVRLEALGGDAGVGGDLGEWMEIRLGGDLEIGREGHGFPQRNSAEPGPGLTSGERTSVFHDAEGFRIVESAKG